VIVFAVFLFLVLVGEVVMIVGCHVGEYQECKEAHAKGQKCLRDYDLG
jgi:hypothetical protein